MTNILNFETYDNDDKNRLIENYHYLAERRCLKQRPFHTPLTLRRSISLEESLADPDVNSLQKPKDKCLLDTLPLPNSQLSSSLNSLCLKLRRYQLLPEYDENIARSADEHDFNWWRTVARLRPIFEKLVMSDYRKNDYFPETFENNEEINFEFCKRRNRRNGVCLEVDRLYYNEQLVLAAMVANQVQLEFNLTFSGFKE